MRKKEKYLSFLSFYTTREGKKEERGTLIISPLSHFPLLYLALNSLSQNTKTKQIYAFLIFYTTREGKKDISDE